MTGITYDIAKEQAVSKWEAIFNIDLFLTKSEWSLETYYQFNPLVQSNPLKSFSEADLYFLSNGVLPVIQIYGNLNHLYINNKSLNSLFDKLIKFGQLNIELLVSNDLLNNAKCLSEEKYIQYRALNVLNAIQGLKLTLNILDGFQNLYSFNFKKETSIIVLFIQNINLSLDMKI
ncbi:hypothetical protein [Lysinibacillus fusiformis]|uniref:hypothetical protein n=1 Tax=Lysinibacillus fusiformis TaxID=28031 RepID=UPI00188036D0|nr:hypothetical protein [Lysinibacillus fusiformis]MBD8523846.1 hypothetical protein [Lysinibacillus fusiformis]